MKALARDARRRISRTTDGPARAGRRSPGPATVVAPVFRCACGGACPRCRDEEAPPRLHPKLEISQPGDPSEREADRVAERVVGVPDPGHATPRVPGGRSAPGPAPGPERMSPSGGASAVDGVTRDLGPGRALDPASRAFFEPRLGVDFGDVRVHTGGTAAESARELNARAYTVGRNVVFGTGRYAPGSAAGKRLLAHELVHVAQQQGGRPQVQRSPDDEGVQRVMIWGGVPDFLDCSTDELDEDPDTSCCSSHTRSLIPGLYDRARAHTDRALRRMRSGARMDGAIEEHFGADALWHRAEIQRRLGLVRDELDEESSHVVRCRIALTARNAIGAQLLSRVDRRLFCRFDVLATGRVGGNVATLCVDADGEPAGGWETLLHEMVHLSGVGNLPARDEATPAQVRAGEYETYRGGAAYPNPTPYSLRNADSYASFVSAVGAAGWSEESVAPALAPTLEAGPAMTLEARPRPGIEAGMLWTPFGTSIQMIVGARALWLSRPPGEEGRPPEPTALRAYAGPELGLRWITTTSGVQFVLDVAGGGGPYVTVEDEVDPALAARLGLGVRFGGPRAGFGISTDVMRLFHFDESGLVGTGADDWLGGIVLRGHWGGSSTTPR